MEHAITIEAGEAFGSGNHPSSAMVLRILGGLAQARAFTNVLDMGCGSGLLTVAAASLTGAKVLAADIQAEAVEMTLRNAEANDVKDLVTAVRSDGYSDPVIAARGPYDLILCNVLAEPAIAWANDLAAHLAEDGLAILSGLLAWQSAQVQEAHARAGLHSILETAEGDWRALLLQHAAKESAA